MRPHQKLGMLTPSAAGDPQRIFEVALPQKELVQDLVNNIAGKDVYLMHKLNIRSRLLPHTTLLHGIRRK